MEKFQKVIVILFFGWLLGYMHHFAATRPIQQDLANRIDSLQKQTEILGLNISRLTSGIISLQETFRVDGGVKITGYSNDPGSVDVPRWRDGKTATNVKAKAGICASDWGYLPPGSLAWIAGYGWCNIQDRGGKVKGRHIDLFFDDVMQARRWGVKRMDILVLQGLHAKH